MTEPNPPRWSDVQLMAWADGELPAAEAAALEADIAQDATLAHRAALMQPTRALVREAWDAKLADAPVPDALRDSVLALVAQDRARRARAEPVVPRPTAPPAPGWREALARLFTGWALPGAVAASVAFGGMGYWLGQSASPLPPAGATLAAGAPAPAALAALLDHLASGEDGQTDGAALTLVASFRDAQGRLCRDFALEPSTGGRLESVACRAPGGAWQVAYAALAPADSSYQPAGPGSALEAYLAGIGAGKPLDPEAERAALGAR
ncbi:hypothetical protein [Pseudorhodoferax sp.]|uniref:hypothetical protein n=1 Tax=Pseudorhodoferax sp. TaxID=1993553 RepID=UPI002DD63613|nr:hypothetical protein [Pseudorhodoferax sp.]